jgi:hypothetical protein
MKLSRLTAFAIAAVISASSVAAPAHAGILGDIIGAPIKIIKKGTGIGAAQAGSSIGALQREQAARRDRVRGTQYGYLGEKPYLACLKVRSSRECNKSYFGQEVVR